MKEEFMNRVRFGCLEIVTFSHQCGSEEEDSSNGKCGVYHVPDYGALKYAGLQGVMSILSEIRPHNDIGSCLPANLMRGNWMMDYIVGRLRRNGNTSKLGDWLESKPFSYIKQLPRLLVPKYFDAIVSELFIVLLIRTRYERFETVDRIWDLHNFLGYFFFKVLDVPICPVWVPLLPSFSHGISATHGRGEKCPSPKAI